MNALEPTATMIFDKGALIQRLGDDEDFIRELVEIFMEDFSTQLEQLQLAIQAKDFEQVRRIAHTMKGASRNTEAKTLSEIAYDLEKSASDGNLSRILDLAKQIKEHFKHFQKVAS